MDLTLLRTFLAVYRAGSLTAAAKALHLSQPAVSSHLKALESNVGRPLFTRLARGIAPTPLAHTLARDVAAPLDALEATSQALRPSAAVGGNPLAGTVLLGGPAALLVAKALPALTPLAADGLRIRACTGLADDLLNALAEGHLDLVIATLRTRRHNVAYTELFEETFTLVAGPDWAGRIDRDTLVVDGAGALTDVPLVSFADDLPIIRRYWRAVFGVRLTNAPAIVINDLYGVQAAVTAGGGITVLPRYLVADALARGDLVELYQPANAPSNTLYLATRRTAPPTPVTQATSRHLLRAAASWR